MNLLCNSWFCFIIKWKVVWLSPIQLFYPTYGLIENASLRIFTNGLQMVYISINYVRLLVHALWMSISTQQLKLTMFNHVMPMWSALGFFHYSNWNKTTLSQSILVNELLWLSLLVIWKLQGFSLESSWGTCQIQWKFQSPRCHYSSLYFNLKI